MHLSPWHSWLALLLGTILIAVGPILVSLASAGLDKREQSTAELRMSFAEQSAVADQATTEGLRAGLLGAGGVALIICGAILVVWQQRALHKAIQRDNLSVRNYNDALSGLHRAVSNLLTGRSENADRKEFFRAVVSAASHLFPFQGVRVCVYQLEGAESEADENKLEALRYVASGGRHDEPRREMTAATKHGQASIKIAKGTQYRCVEDPRSSDEVDYPRGTTWESFLQVPLLLEGRSLGLLSIDTREKVRFSDQHVSIAQAAASLIVLGMTELIRAAEETAPEVRGVQELLRQIALRESREAETPDDTLSTSEGGGANG